MKTFLAIPLLIFCLNLCSKAQEARLVWSDEFKIDGLPDPEKWTYDVGDHGWGNDELEYYSQNDLKNARIENGKLIIEAHADASHPKGYTSARLLTRGKAAWQYGYIEVNAKLPQGRGTWPAIWMLSEENLHGGWPKNGEIDIMEHVGYDPGKVHGTVIRKPSITPRAHKKEALDKSQISTWSSIPMRLIGLKKKSTS
tara:strand:+ start:81397 stop:81990 length:594 start_codon:yes stop_codon:yes gene_type:complete